MSSTGKTKSLHVWSQLSRRFPLTMFYESWGKTSKTTTQNSTYVFNQISSTTISYRHRFLRCDLSQMGQQLNRPLMYEYFCVRFCLGASLEEFLCVVMTIKDTYLPSFLCPFLEWYLMPFTFLQRFLQPGTGQAKGLSCDELTPEDGWCPFCLNKRLTFLGSRPTIFAGVTWIRETYLTPQRKMNSELYSSTVVQESLLSSVWLIMSSSSSSLPEKYVACY